MRIRAATSMSRILASTAVSLLVCVGISAPATAQVLRQWDNGEISDVKQNVKDALDDTRDILTDTNGVKDLVDIVNDHVGRPRRGPPGVHRRPARERPVPDRGRTGSEGRIPRNDCGPGSPCARFRNDIVGFVHDLRSITGLLLQFNGSSSLDLNVDDSRTAQLLEAIPGKALFPLYAALNANGPLFDNGLDDFFGQLVGNLTFARDVLNGNDPIDQSAASALAAQAALDLCGDGNVDAGEECDDGNSENGDGCSRECRIELPELPPVCRVVLEVPTAVRYVAADLCAGAIHMKLLGKIVFAHGEEGVLGSTDISAQGFVGIAVDDNKQKKWGERLDKASDIIAQFGNAVDDELIYCAALGQRARLVDLLQSKVAPWGKGQARSKNGRR